MTDSTSTMRMIGAVETALDKTKGNRGTSFLTALHEQGYQVEMVPPLDAPGYEIANVGTLAREPAFPQLLSPDGADAEPAPIVHHRRGATGG